MAPLTSRASRGGCARLSRQPRSTRRLGRMAFDMELEFWFWKPRIYSPRGSLTSGPSHGDNARPGAPAAAHAEARQSRFFGADLTMFLDMQDRIPEGPTHFLALAWAPASGGALRAAHGEARQSRLLRRIKVCFRNPGSNPLRAHSVLGPRMGTTLVQPRPPRRTRRLGQGLFLRT